MSGRPFIEARTSATTAGRSRCRRPLRAHHRGGQPLINISVLTDVAAPERAALHRGASSHASTVNVGLDCRPGGDPSSRLQSQHRALLLQVDHRAPERGALHRGLQMAQPLRQEIITGRLPWAGGSSSRRVRARRRRGGRGRVAVPERAALHRGMYNVTAQGNGCAAAPGRGGPLSRRAVGRVGLGRVARIMDRRKRAQTYQPAGNYSRSAVDVQVLKPST